MFFNKFILKNLMKKITVFSVFVFAIMIFAFGFSGDKSDRMLMNNVVIQFEATNGNGNNLWLDNFSIGTRYDNDLTISAFSLKDKNYLIPGVTSTSVSPVVTVMNVGRSTSASATITLSDQASYNITKTVSSMSSGYTTAVTFDAMTFNLNTAKNLKVYINWSTDQNHNNDTLTQSTIFLPGVQKKILFEAHTSTTCGPCASQNPYLDAFIQTHFDSLVAIKYHVWWPSPGNDPMYLLNIPQVRVRTLYNSVSAVPTLQIDGVKQQISAYSTTSNLLNPFNERRAMGSPIGLTVTDTRLTGDTIKATITINVVSALPSNVDYRLRINALERKVVYSSAPGSNGETTFYDVFRMMYPSSNGISINYSPGTYTVEYKYKRDAGWIDSMMYTAVFIQDEYTHEVINCAKVRNYYKRDNISLPKITDNSLQPQYLELTDAFQYNSGIGLQTETMESTIPPVGWSIINADSNFTFWQYIYSAVNGPSFNGTKSIRLSLYSYTVNLGTTDILKTRVYNNISVDDSIKFDWAYAQRSSYSDRLVVKISIDGGSTFPYTIFDKQGSALGTTSPTTSSFVPTSGQWGTFAARIGTVTGVEPTGNFTATKYELLQNYPNPFNPITNIKYQIAKSNLVTLKVYDILGKEVATLVNENMKAGTYEVMFDASNVPSGVYFYKISAGSYSDTKKMLLIK